MGGKSSKSLSNPLLFVQLFFLHHLETVVEVLPDDVQGGNDTSQIHQKCLRHPDGQHGVLLSQGLTSSDAVTIFLPDEVTHEKL